MMSYLRTEGKFNVYEFECPHCAIYIQRPAVGMFGHPRLEEIVMTRGGVA